MPRRPSSGPNKGKKWSAEHRRNYMATIRAKAAKAGMHDATTPTTLSAFVDTELERLEAEIERLQKVRDLLR